MGLIYVDSDSHARVEMPLEGVHASIKIVNLVAEVQIVQFYANPRPNAIDCVYEFPMDDYAAVCGFEVDLGDRVLVGEVKERNAARQTYNEAVSRGQTASLLEQNKPDIFCQNVGNIPPLTRLSVRITYITELRVQADTGAVVFCLPTSIAPRYSPYSGREKLHSFASKWQDSCLGRRVLSYEGYQAWNGTGRLPGWQAWEYSVSKFVVDRENPAPFSFLCEIEMPSDIVKIQSPTFPNLNFVQPEKSDLSKVICSFFNDKEPMGKDLVLEIHPEQLFEPSCLVELDENGGGCMMATLIPQLELKPEKREIVFVIDQSGSMSGLKLEAAKRALQILLRSLPMSCFFNVYRFESDFASLFETSQPYTKENFDAACKFVNNIVATGGTEIYRPLNHIFSNPPQYPRQVFVLTDGEVSNTEQVIELCRINSTNSRVFTIGIGNEVSRHLVQGMARTGTGTCEFIIGKDLDGASMALETKLINQLKLATYPTISNISIDWMTTQQLANATKTPSREESNAVGSGFSAFVFEDSSSTIQQAPFLPPPLFSGSKFVSYCFFKPNTSFGREIVLSCQTPEGIKNFGVPVRKLSGNSRTCHLLAARAMIRDLTEGTSVLHFQKREDGSKLWRPVQANANQVRQRLVDLGVRFGLVSSETSFVAVERWLKDGRAVNQVIHSSSRSMIDLDEQRAMLDLTMKVQQSLQSNLSLSRSIAVQLDSLSADSLQANSEVFYQHSRGLSYNPFSRMGESVSDFFSAVGTYFSSRPTSTATTTTTVLGNEGKSALATSTESGVGTKEPAFGMSVPMPPSKPVITNSKKNLQAILMMQGFDGSIPSTDQDFIQLGFNLSKAEATSKLIAKDFPTINPSFAVQLVAALLFIIVLEKEFATSKNVWEIAVQKTSAWMISNLTQGQSILALKAIVETQI